MKPGIRIIIIQQELWLNMLEKQCHDMKTWVSGTSKYMGVHKLWKPKCYQLKKLCNGVSGSPLQLDMTRENRQVE